MDLKDIPQHDKMLIVTNQRVLETRLKMMQRTLDHLTHLVEDFATDKESLPTGTLCGARTQNGKPCRNYYVSCHYRLSGVHR